ncbi:MAG: SOS response-associated peptidase [Balneolaceae bacterium]|jgi:putative SOS response-associated peptidase YedK
MCVYYDAHGIKHYIGDYGVDKSDQLEIEFEENYVVRPTNKAPIVWHDPEIDKRRASLFEFAMIPSWTKSEADARKNRYKFFNARDDRLMESSLWRPRFESKRCLIPANGFYEPHKYHKKVNQPGGRKPSDSIPFYFRLKSTDYFAFAGLYDEWTHPQTGEVIPTFTIITTDPNRQMERIHNKNPRQPVILHKKDYDFWLNPMVNPSAYFDQNIFLPWPDEDMEHWQVTKQLDYNGTGEELIKPVQTPVDIETTGEQGNLFE